MSSESETTLRRGCWCSSAQARTASRPEYSAKLLVRLPRNSESSARVLPWSSVMTAPKPAGPGLPRAPPSQWAWIHFGWPAAAGGGSEKRDIRFSLAALGWVGGGQSSGAAGDDFSSAPVSIEVSVF